jgi:hypothetical protein
MLAAELFSVFLEAPMKLTSSYSDRAKFARPAWPWRPRLEILETRELPSTCAVDRLTDNNPAGGGEGGNGMGDLRYCMTQAADGDAITFSVAGTINLNGVLPQVTQSITIDGPGPDLLTVRRSTGGNYRIFKVTGDPTVMIAGLTIANGYTTDSSGGGGLYIGGGTVQVANCRIMDNTAGFSSNYSSNGGGIAIANGNVTIYDCTLNHNGASAKIAGYGGGVFATGGTVTVAYSTLSNNSASGVDAGFGGGIFAAAVLTVDSSTINGNSVGGGQDDWGGGLDVPPATVVINSTISGNSANGPGKSGGLYGGSVLRNTIIAGNYAQSSPDVSGTFSSQGHNLIGDSSGGTGFTDTDLLGTSDNPLDPVLGPLQDNGGPTQTMALLPGSPAIDAGDNTDAPDWDQRGPGYPRIVNGIIDIGAFEVQNAGGGPSTLRQTHDSEPILRALVSELPPSPTLAALPLTRTVPGEAMTWCVTRDIAPSPNETTDPRPVSIDSWLASVHERAPGQMRAWRPEGGAFRRVWLILDLFQQEAGLDT